MDEPHDAELDIGGKCSVIVMSDSLGSNSQVGNPDEFAQSVSIDSRILEQR